MNKTEFLQALADGLAAASPEERVAAVQYYTEYLDDAGPERVAEVIEELGGPDKVIADILGSPAPQPSQSWTPPTTPTTGGWFPPEAPRAPEPPPQWTQAAPPVFDGASNLPVHQPQPTQAGYSTRNNGIAKLILVVLALCFIVPLLGGMGGVFIGVAVALLCLFFVPVILGLALLASGIAVVVTGFFIIPAFLGSGLIYLGIGGALFGLGLLCLYAGVRLMGRTLPAAVRGICRLFGSLFGKVKSFIQGGRTYG